MRRFLSMIVSRQEAEYAADVINTIRLRDWLWGTVAAGAITVVLPMIVSLFEVREAWLP